MRRKGGRSTAGYGEGPDWADRGAGGTALRSPENLMGGRGGGEERKAGRAREDRADEPRSRRSPE